MNCDNQQKIIDMLNLIETRLSHIEANILQLKEDNIVVGTSCAKMQTHITFVEDVYNKIKSPLNYFIGTKTDLPQINNSINK